MIYNSFSLLNLPTIARHFRARVGRSRKFEVAIVIATRPSFLDQARPRAYQRFSSDSNSGPAGMELSLSSRGGVVACGGNSSRGSRLSAMISSSPLQLSVSSSDWGVANRWFLGMKVGSTVGSETSLSRWTKCPSTCGWTTKVFELGRPLISNDKAPTLGLTTYGATYW